MTVTLTEIREHWTVTDVMAAHDYLDAVEAARPVGGG
jgi:hypothetical protein